MQSFEVLAARYSNRNKCIEVVKEITNDDGSTELMLHLFAPDILECRAAEYGVDDPDELVEMVLWEPYMQSIPLLEVTASTAAQLHRGQRATAKAALSPKKVRTKVDKQERLRSAGVDQKYIDALEEDPLAEIKRLCPIDKDTLRLKREHVQRIRDKVAERAAKRAPQQALDRAAVIRKQAAMQSARAAQAQATPDKVAKPTHVTIHLRKESKAQLAE